MPQKFWFAFLNSDQCWASFIFCCPSVCLLLEKCPYIDLSPIVWIRLFVFLILELCGLQVILRLFFICHWYSFSHSRACLFILFKGFFAVQKLFRWGDGSRGNESNGEPSNEALLAVYVTLCHVGPVTNRCKPELVHGLGVGYHLCYISSEEIQWECWSQGQEGVIYLWQ